MSDTLNCVEGGAGTCRNADVIEKLRAELQAAHSDIENLRGVITDMHVLLSDKGVPDGATLSYRIRLMADQRDAAQAQVAALQQEKELLNDAANNAEAGVLMLNRELTTAQSQVAVLKHLIEIATIPDGLSSYCPWCRGNLVTYGKGHKPDCPRQIALGLKG